MKREGFWLNKSECTHVSPPYLDNRSTALNQSIYCALPTISLFHSATQVIHSDKCKSVGSERRRRCLCLCKPVGFCQRVMSLMDHASYLYASQSAIETYKWTLCWFSTTALFRHPLIALIRAVMSIGWLINAVTRPQLRAPISSLAVSHHCRWLTWVYHITLLSSAFHMVIEMTLGRIWCYL